MPCQDPMDAFDPILRVSVPPKSQRLAEELVSKAHDRHHLIGLIAAALKQAGVDSRR